MFLRVKYFKTKIEYRSADIAKIFRLTTLDSLISIVSTTNKILPRHSPEPHIYEINNNTTVYSFLANTQPYNRLD